MTTWEHNTNKPGYASEVTASRLVELVAKAMRKLKPHKPRFTCILLSNEHLQRLKEHIPPATTELREAFSPISSVDRYMGLPFFVYHTQEERFTLRANLIQAGHTICEVE